MTATVVAWLSLIVAIVAAVGYLLCNGGATKANFATLFSYAWPAALLAFLLHADKMQHLP